MGIFKKKSFHVIFFFLQPFFTLLYYLKNFRKQHAKNVMWLFTIFYGATFAIGVESQGSDIVRYIAEIELLNRKGFDFQEALQYFYLSGEIDILNTLLAFFVSYFTSNGFYLIVLYAVIYGYFFSRNMWYVLDRLVGRTKFFTKILLFCLFLAIPLWNMNGFRFWTAAHMFLFGLLPFLIEGKKKSLIWCLITPFLLHFSFLVALLPLGIFLLFGNRIKFYYLFFLFTLFLSEINVSSINEIANSYAPEVLVERSGSYISEENVGILREEGRLDVNKVWYANYYTLILRYTLTAFLLVFYWTFKFKKETNKKLIKLLSFILLFYGVTNILSMIPSGIRFVKVANLLTLSFLVIYLQGRIGNKNLYRLSKIAIPFLMIFIIISLRESWYSFSFMTVFGNPITAIFTFGENTSLNDIIKGL